MQKNARKTKSCTPVLRRRHHHSGLFQAEALKTEKAMNNKTERQTEYKRTEDSYRKAHAYNETVVKLQLLYVYN